MHGPMKVKFFKISMTALELWEGKICLLEDRNTTSIKVRKCIKFLSDKYKQVKRPLIKPDTA